VFAGMSLDPMVNRDSTPCGASGRYINADSDEGDH
jgi:hypothetical protein